MTYVNFKLDTDADGIALITWDAPGRSMNVIDRNVIEGLSDIVETVAGDGAIRGAVITSGKEAFCAGADLPMLEASIHAFAEMARARGEEAAATVLFEDSRKLSLLYRRLETCGKPWVAAITGRRWVVVSSFAWRAITGSRARARTRAWDCRKSRSVSFLAPAGRNASPA